MTWSDRGGIPRLPKDQAGDWGIVRGEQGILGEGTLSVSNVPREELGLAMVSIGLGGQESIPVSAIVYRLLQVQAMIF